MNIRKTVKDARRGHAARRTLPAADAGIRTAACAALLLAGTASRQAFADERYWGVYNGGDMWVESNWEGSNRPVETDRINLNKDQTAPIWLSVIMR